MNLHLCADGNFIAKSMRVFERFYPGENIFLVMRWEGNIKRFPEDFLVYYFKSKDPEIMTKVEELCKNNKIDHIILHGLYTNFYPVLNYVKKQSADVKTYWIFWGFELYSGLAEKNQYNLLDSKSLFSKLTYMTPSPVNAFLRKIKGIKSRYSTLTDFLPLIDYFLFWLPKDFELLKANFDCNIKYKHFQYGATFKEEAVAMGELKPMHKEPRIMVNHQATINGNFETVFKNLKNMGADQSFDIIVPLSYGSDYVKPVVNKIGKKMFGDHFKPMYDLMPLDEYRVFLSSVQVAIFGQHRQEATGNIIALLRTGAKVFLRDDNPLLPYYRNKGYILYSFEKDFNSIEDLKPLTDEQQLHNMETFRDKKVYYEDFMPTLFDED